MTIKEMLQSFYDSLAKKDDAWQEYLADDVVFTDSNKKLHEEGKQAFIQSYSDFLKTVEDVKVKQIIIEGENACVVTGYHYVSPKGDKLNQNDAEVWQIKGGKLSSLTIYFDITEYRSFMGR
jgi:ketosteroid isomerase-like protein